MGSGGATFATILLDIGVNPNVAQNPLGHSDISTTLGVYSHVVSEIYDGVAVQINAAFEDITGGIYKPQIGVGQVEELIGLLDKELRDYA